MQLIISKVQINGINEKLFSLYFYIFSIMSGIIYLIPQYSKYVLLFVVGIMLFISIIYNNFKLRNTISIMIITIFMGLLFIFDFVFRSNSFLSTYAYYFIIFGLIPIYFYAQTRDNNIILEQYSKISILVFFMYFWTPIGGYTVFSDYMAFGFNFALPVFCGLYIARKRLHYKWTIILEMIMFAELIVFSNKSAVIAGLIFILLYNLFIETWNLKHFIKIFLGVIILLIAIYNINILLLYLSHILNFFGINSYSIKTFQRIIETQELTVGLTNRDVIWKLALKYFREHWILGMGTGGFQSVSGIYPHNLFIDILVQYGIVGMIVFIFGLFRTLKKIYIKHDNSDKLFIILLVSLGLVPLTFSMIFYESLPFWIFIYYGLIKLSKKVAMN